MSKPNSQNISTSSNEYVFGLQPYVLSITDGIDIFENLFQFATTTPFYDDCFKTHNNK